MLAGLSGVGLSRAPEQVLVRLGALIDARATGDDIQVESVTTATTTKQNQNGTRDLFLNGKNKTESTTRKLNAFLLADDTTRARRPLISKVLSSRSNNSSSNNNNNNNDCATATTTATANNHSHLCFTRAKSHNVTAHSKEGKRSVNATSAPPTATWFQNASTPLPRLSEETTTTAAKATANKRLVRDLLFDHSSPSAHLSAQLDNRTSWNETSNIPVPLLLVNKNSTIQDDDFVSQTRDKIIGQNESAQEAMLASQESLQLQLQGQHRHQLFELTSSSNGLAAGGNLIESRPPFTSLEWLMIVTLISIILISIVGNLLVCIAIFTDRRLRKLGNAFIVSLAIADLFVSFLVMTFALHNDLMDEWVFGAWFCDIWISFDIMCCTASILNLCAISLDRFIHIKDCLLYNQLMTRRVAISAVIMIWIISALVSFVPINLGWHKPSSGLRLPPPTLASTAAAASSSRVNSEQNFHDLSAPMGLASGRVQQRQEEEEQEEEQDGTKSEITKRWIENSIVDKSNYDKETRNGERAGGGPLFSGSSSSGEKVEKSLIKSELLSGRKQGQTLNKVQDKQIEGRRSPLAGARRRRQAHKSDTEQKMQTTNSLHKNKRQLMDEHDNVARHLSAPFYDELQKQQQQRQLAVGHHHKAINLQTTLTANETQPAPAQCMLTLTPTYAVISSTISFYIPCIIMLGLYSKLFACARRHVKNIKAISKAPNPIGGGGGGGSGGHLTQANNENNNAHISNSSSVSASAAAMIVAAAAAAAAGPLTPVANRARRFFSESFRGRSQANEATQNENENGNQNQSNVSNSQQTAGDGCAQNCVTDTTSEPAGELSRTSHLHGGGGRGGKARTWIKFGRRTKKSSCRDLSLSRNNDGDLERFVADRNEKLARGEKIERAQTKLPRAAAAAATVRAGELEQIEQSRCGREAEAEEETDAERAAAAAAGQLVVRTESETTNGQQRGPNGPAHKQRLVLRSILSNERQHDRDESSQSAAVTQVNESEPFLKSFKQTESSETTINSTIAAIMRAQTIDDENSLAGNSASAAAVAAGDRIYRGNKKSTSSSNATSVKLNFTTTKAPGQIGTLRSSNATVDLENLRVHSNHMDASGTTGGKKQKNQQAARGAQRTRALQARHLQQPTKQQTSQLATHKAAITLGIIMGTFLLCWLPFFCLNIIKAFYADLIPSSLFRASTWLGYANSALNPIIYGIHNSEFRNAFNRIFFKHLTLKNGRQYLNRRFSYDLRSHHGQQQQQQIRNRIDCQGSDNNNNNNNTSNINFNNNGHSYHQRQSSYASHERLAGPTATVTTAAAAAAAAANPSYSVLTSKTLETMEELAQQKSLNKLQQQQQRDTTTATTSKANNYSSSTPSRDGNNNNNKRHRARNSSAIDQQECLNLLNCLQERRETATTLRSNTTVHRTSDDFSATSAAKVDTVELMRQPSLQTLAIS